jgi:hypothetical protein
MPDGSSECGTPGAVQRHYREGTDPCPQDLKAWAAYMRRWRAERKARAAAGAERTARAAAEAARKAQAREQREATVMAAHEAGTLVLG